ncbi:MAG: hypothetical protein R2751_14815 [Bacteroidales bacterium]
MISGKYVLWFWIVFLLGGLHACEKNEPVLLQGSILGQVRVRSQCNEPEQDYSGISLTIHSESKTFETSPNAEGTYHFEDIPCDMYELRIEKENYVSSFGTQQIKHLGGYSPTFVDASLYAVPSFEIHLDSLSFAWGYPAVYFHSPELFHAAPFNWDGVNSCFYCFVDTTASVSGTEYLHRYQTYAFPTYYDNYGYYATLDASLGYDADSLFLRMAPSAFGQSQGGYTEGSLGKMSNTVAWKIPD